MLGSWTVFFSIAMGSSPSVHKDKAQSHGSGAVGSRPRLPQATTFPPPASLAAMDAQAQAPDLQQLLQQVLQLGQQVQNLTAALTDANNKIT